MGEIINLRAARKARTRAGDAARADANRIAFGASKAEKRAARAETERAKRRLDGAELPGLTDDDRIGEP